MDELKNSNKNLIESISKKDEEFKIFKALQTSIHEKFTKETDDLTKYQIDMIVQKQQELKKLKTSHDLLYQEMTSKDQ